MSLQFSSDQFAVTSTTSADAISLAFSGTADVHALTFMDTFAPAVHEEACRLGVKEVVIDLTKLEFMNSSCIKGFVTWISRVRDLPADRAYRVRFRSSRTIHWQRRSLVALSRFAPNLVSIDET